MIMYILYFLALLIGFCIIPTAILIYKKKITFFNGVFLGTFLLLTSFGCVVFGFTMVNGYSPIDSFLNNLFENLKLVFNMVNDIPAGNQQAIFKLIDEMKNIYITLLPSMIIMSCLIWAYISIMFIKGILAIFKKDTSGFKKFSQLKMPKSALFIAAVAFIVSSIVGDGKAGYALMNFSSIILSLTTICGLSFIDYKLRKKVRFAVVRIIIYMVLVLMLNYILGDATGLFLFVGMFDTVFDFRKRDEKPEIDS